MQDLGFHPHYCKQQPVLEVIHKPPSLFMGNKTILRFKGSRCCDPLKKKRSKRGEIHEFLFFSGLLFYYCAVAKSVVGRENQTSEYALTDSLKGREAPENQTTPPSGYFGQLECKYFVDRRNCTLSSGKRRGVRFWSESRTAVVLGKSVFHVSHVEVVKAWNLDCTATRGDVCGDVRIFDITDGLPNCHFAEDVCGAKKTIMAYGILF